MGLFDFFSSSSSPDGVGTDLLQAYFNEASKFPEFNFGSYDAWINYLNSKVPDFVPFIGELVINNSASTSVDDSRDRLVRLANELGGKATIPQITQSAGGRGDTVNWAQAIPSVALDSVEQISEAAQNIGAGVMSTASALRYLPWILGAGAGLYIYVMAKSSGTHVGKGIRRFSEEAGKGVRSLAEAGSERLRRKS